MLNRLRWLRFWAPKPQPPRLSATLWLGPDGTLWGRAWPLGPRPVERPVAGFDHRGALLLSQARPCE